jgi:hypothetical protein
MTATIIDVLENALGEITAARLESLNEAELAQLADAVNAFYDTWEPPALTSDELRLYFGGWIAGNLGNPESRQYLYMSLLYAPGVVMHDPVAEWFDPHRNSLQVPAPIRSSQGGMLYQGAEPQLRRGSGYHLFRDEPERSRTWLAGAAPVLVELAPLIRSGVVIPVPQWAIVRQRQMSVLAAVRNDVKDSDLANLIADYPEYPPPRTDQIRGMEVGLGKTAPGDAQRAIIQNPSYFLNKTLAVADATYSRYVPPAPADAAMLEYRIGRLGHELQRKNIDLSVIAALASSDLPFLTDLDPKTLLAIRRDESAFADWRAQLRDVTRRIEGLPSADDFADEAREVLSDVLLPRAREVKEAVSRSGVMRAAAKEQGLNLTIGTASVAGGAALLGAPIGPAALVGLGISAVARWAYTSVFGAKPSGANGVLARLVRR